ncbi:MAG: hypothetical protein M3P95_08370 [Actinomycetota bacterium]|nr:hypothetical protein [Actinomycetota bacterium]
MPSSTPSDHPQDAGDDASASRAVPRGSSDADDPDTSAQGSGKQFERGTESVPGHEDDAASTGPASGAGASASGKRFARGTDSDGDGQTYDQTR